MSFPCLEMTLEMTSQSNIPALFYNTREEVRESEREPERKR